MPMSPRSLPPLHAVRYMAKRTALTTLSLDVLTQQWMGCTSKGDMPVLALVSKPSSKGRYGSSLIGMDACRNERFLEQGIEVPEEVSQALPDWLFHNGNDSAQHQSHPDAVFVRSLPGPSDGPHLPKLFPLRFLLKTGTFSLWNSNSALTPTPSPLCNLQLPSMPAL
eukprot:1152259-Pelagomonas_calceolata.AAC.2